MLRAWVIAATDTRVLVQKASCSARKVDCMQLFVRVARREFAEILQFFRAISAQHLRELDAKRALSRKGINS